MLTFWGGEGCAGHTVSWDWSHLPTMLQINQMGFWAVLLSLQHFRNLLVGRAVLIQTDNVTVAAYINRQGGTHSIPLNALAAQFWNWCRGNAIVPTAVYLPGQDNLVADFLSRGRLLPWREYARVWGLFTWTYSCRASTISSPVIAREPKILAPGK